MQANSIQFTWRGSVTRVFSGQFQYTLGRTQNNTNGVAWFPANDYDSRGEWARADFDQRHRVDGLGTIKLGTQMRLGVAVSLYSGKPYTLLAGQDLFNNGRGTARPVGVPRNSLTGPGYADVDLRWSRDLFVRKAKAADEGTSLTLGVDAFNLLNHTNYVAYVGTIDSPLFGRANAAQPPRRLQLSLRAKF
jgi:hypothetical protein